MKRINKHAVLIAALITLTFSSSLFAGETPVYIHGTITEPAVCKVNNDQDINVDFGEIRTDRIDGTNYSRTINLTVTCTANPQNTLQMLTTGAQSSISNGALATSKTDLGIQLKQGGSNVVLGTPFNINYPNPVALQAVPIKKKNATLGTGAFTATTTVVVNYQ